jgi:proliferating cell nuclear antigen
MFEARLLQGSLLKKIIESIKDLVTDANLDCSATGMTLQVWRNSLLGQLECELCVVCG